MRRAAWGLVLGYTGLLLFLLWGPPADSPPLFPHDDKVFHAVAFTGIGASWWWVTHRPRFVAIFGLAMAVITEVVQGMLPWPRSMDPLDMLADAVGVALGLWGAKTASRKRAKGVPGGERPSGVRSRRDSNPG